MMKTFMSLKSKQNVIQPLCRKDLTEFFMFEAGFSLMFAENNIDKDDVSYVCGIAFEAYLSLNQVLFAVNKE